MDTDVTGSEQAQHRLADPGGRHRHRPWFGGVHDDQDPVPHTPGPQRGLGQQGGFPWGGGALVGRTGDHHRDPTGLEPGQGVTS